MALYLRQALIPSTATTFDAVLIFAFFGALGVLAWLIQQKKLDVKTFFGMPTLVIAAAYTALILSGINLATWGFAGQVLYYAAKVASHVFGLPWLIATVVIATPVYIYQQIKG